MCPAGLSGDTAVLVVTALTFRRRWAGAAHPVVVTGRQRLQIRTSPSRPPGSRKNMLWTEPKSLTVPSLAPALTNRLRIVANASGDADSATDDLFKAEVAAARAQSYAGSMAATSPRPRRTVTNPAV